MKKFILLGSIALSFMSVGALAADSPNMSKPSKEMREKMAVTHEKMATCLRSDKPIKDCRREMRKQCQETMGKNGCPMMNHHEDGDKSEKTQK